MSIDGELVMPREVEIFSVRELAPDVRANIEAADEDMLSPAAARAPHRALSTKPALIY